MINVYTRLMLLSAGIMSILAVGCITGTNTFSSATVPATRYCSIDDATEPLSVIPVTAERSSVKRDHDRGDVRGEKVSLVP